jgi:hypothetical protein
MRIAIRKDRDIYGIRTNVECGKRKFQQLENIKHVKKRTIVLEISRSVRPRSVEKLITCIFILGQGYNE